MLLLHLVLQKLRHFAGRRAPVVPPIGSAQLQCTLSELCRDKEESLKLPNGTWSYVTKQNSPGDTARMAKLGLVKDGAEALLADHKLVDLSLQTKWIPLVTIKILVNSTGGSKLFLHVAEGGTYQ